MDNKTNRDGGVVAERGRLAAVADDAAGLDELHVVDSADLRLGARYYAFQYKGEFAATGGSTD